MRIVADTNTLVAGFGWSGPPARVVDAILAGRLTLIISPLLAEELQRVLRYPKLAAIFPEPEHISALLAAITEPVQPIRRVSVLIDEPDNRVLEAAVAGQADAIVTGDAELLALEIFEDIPILTARNLLDMLSTPEP